MDTYEVLSLLFLGGTFLIALLAYLVHPETGWIIWTQHQGYIVILFQTSF